jgi:hypothetical protein
LDGKRGEDRTWELLVEVDAFEGRRSVSRAANPDEITEFPARGGIGGAFKIDREDSRSNDRFVFWVRLDDGRGVDCWLVGVTCCCAEDASVEPKLEFNCAAAALPIFRKFWAIWTADLGGGETQALVEVVVPCPGVMKAACFCCEWSDWKTKKFRKSLEKHVAKQFNHFLLFSRKTNVKLISAKNHSTKGLSFHGNFWIDNKNFVF